MLTFCHALSELGRIDRAAHGVVAAFAPASALATGAVGAGWCLETCEHNAVRRLRGLVDRLLPDLPAAAGQHRLRLLATAHTTLVAAAFLESIQEVFGPAYRSVRLTADEKALAMRDGPHRPSMERIWRTEAGIPGAGIGFADNLHRRLEPFLESAASTCALFLADLPQWDRADSRHRLDARTAAARSVRRYQEYYRQLAADIPEFPAWQPAGAAPAPGEPLMARLESMLTRAAPAAPAGGTRDLLARANRAILRRPILDGLDVPLSRMPAVAEIYVKPRFRYAVIDATARPADEGWWSRQPLATGIDEFVGRYLMSPDCARTPMIVLGHPGAGKSLLTRILAAFLPGNGYTAIHIPLRRVPPDTSVHQQIQQGLDDRMHDRIRWADLMADSAEQTTRVVFLDGLDELMQASKAAHSRYLYEVAEFQRDESDLGHAVAAVVTSRTVMADRVQMPAGAVVVRLEEFDEDQIGDWLSTWNAANDATDGFRALDLEVALRAGELSRQPLLLTMLALYVADPSAPDLADIENSADLYGRLIHNFIARDVLKDVDAPAGRGIDPAKAELLRRRFLSVASFAMFNRGLQYVTEDEFQQDLEALKLAAPPARADLAVTPLSPARQTLGQFFFVVQSGDGEQRPHHALPATYEFLHATFGEYLVSTEIVRQLRRLAEQIEDDLGFGLAEPVDDSMLRALLSHRPLVGSIRTLTFVAEQAPDEGVPEVLRRLIRQGRGGAAGDRYPGYNPSARDDIERTAVYLNNLVALLVYVGGPARINQLGPPGADPIRSWRSMVRLWRAGLDDSDWAMVVQALTTDWGAGVVSAGPTDGDSLVGEARLLGDLRTEALLLSGSVAWGGETPVGRDEVAVHRYLLAALTRGSPAEMTSVPVFENIAGRLDRLGAPPTHISQLMLFRAVDRSAPDHLRPERRKAIRSQIDRLTSALGLANVRPDPKSRGIAPANRAAHPLPPGYFDLLQEEQSLYTHDDVLISGIVGDYFLSARKPPGRRVPRMMTDRVDFALREWDRFTGRLLALADEWQRAAVPPAQARIVGLGQAPGEPAPPARRRKPGKRRK